MNILAIESSCDESAAAVIRDGTEIVSSVVASSKEMHEKWGGIVPEVAAREQLASILPVITEALQHCKDTKIQKDKDIKRIIEKNIDAIAITVGPGLIGSLLIGVETAKTIAFVCQKPIIPVNHVLAHQYANFLNSYQLSDVSYHTKKNNNSAMKQFNNDTIVFPAISLVVSGGHTELYLMENKRVLRWLGGTIDDAAGEAFDKTARLLGFGSQGGAAIEKASRKYDVRSMKYDVRIKLPRPMIRDESLNFSFSGLKTAILREVEKLKHAKKLDEKIIAYLAYEVQEAITDVLVAKTLKAAEMYNAKSILISGGVASNSRLREKFLSTISQPPHLPISFHCPPVELCTDNAAFIGSYAYFRGKKEDWHDITAIPDLSVEETEIPSTKHQISNNI
jgi:N6-L-threonylcarbamoyladenine synthase